MRIVHEDDVPVEQRRSPRGAFEIHRRHVSLALGGVKDTGPWGGGHPFDVELARIPPGRKGYPCHSHAAQSEYYLVIAGTGRVVGADGPGERIRPGSHVWVPPGEAHQIVNDGDQDLVYYVIADHHPSDVTTYPRTGKRQIKPEYRCVRIEDVGYYDGEE